MTSKYKPLVYMAIKVRTRQGWMSQTDPERMHIRASVHDAFCLAIMDRQCFTWPGKHAGSIAQPTGSKYRPKNLVIPSCPCTLIMFHKPSSSDLGAQGCIQASWILEHWSSEKYCIESVSKYSQGIFNIVVKNYNSVVGCGEDR